MQLPQLQGHHQPTNNIITPNLKKKTLRATGTTIINYIYYNGAEASAPPQHQSAQQQQQQQQQRIYDAYGEEVEPYEV